MASETQATPNSFVANLSRGEIPSLYGLRGVAALVVVFYHYIDGWKFIAFFPGYFAVTLFFILSGLLITWLLLKEIDGNGLIDKRQFYWRRALRLFPVFYAVWALCRLSGPFAGSWATFFYMGDYYHALTQRYNILTSAWSLGVEEKFYLLWPFVLTSMKRTRLIKVLFAVMIAEPIYRSVLSLLGHQAYTWFAFDTRVDAIVVGCSIALAVKNGWIVPGWVSHPFTPICALILVFALQDQKDLVTYLLAVILVSVVSRPGAILNNLVAKYFGAISYSLYLCHEYARNIVWQKVFGEVHWHNSAFILISQLFTAIALASVLHFSIERPFLRLKGRFGSNAKALPAHPGRRSDRKTRPSLVAQQDS